MKLLVDNQLPLALANHLRQRGHDCSHVLEVGLDAATDVDVWTRCAGAGWTLITKDEDFVFLANRPSDRGQLIWVRLGNCRNEVLIAAFDRVHDQLVEAFASGQRIVELR